jgi:glycosyltransferase involved in cell wall biosynthesis
MISAVVLTKNEEQNMRKCLESVKWCDEIIVVDDGSSDRTIGIAEKYKVTVYRNPLNGDFSAQRNFGISKAKYDWIVFIDADEIVSDALAYEMSNVIGLKDQNPENFNGFYIKRSDFIWRKQLRYGESGNIKLLRLGKKGMGVWRGRTHEKWQIMGDVGSLENPILHFPHKTLTEFLEEVNFYTDIRAKELKLKNTEVFFWTIILYPLGKFIVNYILKRGFMDGMQGLVFAIIMSFHSFLVRGKLWLKNE